LFSVSHSEIELAEGATTTVTAKAGGALKVAWILKEESEVSVIAVDRFAVTLPAGRVTGDTARTLMFVAVFPEGTRTITKPVNIIETLPEPLVALQAPAAWDGRSEIEVPLSVSNKLALPAKGVGDLKTTWTVSGGAVIRQDFAEKLVLSRSQYTGPIVVRAEVTNGGTASIATASMVVKEPLVDAWVHRIPEKDEQPEDNQFHARDDSNEGTLYYNGVLEQVADAVFLKLYADDKLVRTETQPLGQDRTFSLTTRLKPGLIRYRVDFGAKTGNTEKVLRVVKNLVCGDAFIIQGQSNAEACGPNNGPAMDASTPLGDCVRSYGNS